VSCFFICYHVEFIGLMESVIHQIESKHKKHAVVAVKSGDTVRVHQEVIEGSKKRVQIFEGLVIKVSRRNSLTSTFTVRRVANGVGVEKTFLVHAPSILKIEVVRRSKVRRNYLTYMRERTGKRARLSNVDFDREAVNAVHDKKSEAEEAAIKEEQKESHDTDLKETDKEAKKANEPKVEKSEADKLEEQPKLRPEAKDPAQEQNKEK
jgi:large subunit ribosomal protein L19